MKVWEIWLLLGIALLLLIGSAYFYRYSSTFLKSTSIKTERLSTLLNSGFVDSGKELLLSSEKTKKLLQNELKFAESYNQGMVKIQKSFKHLSELFFIIGGVIIVLCFSLYKRIKKLKHNKSVELTACR